MKLYVVRHVKAGSRTSWDGDDDRERPVSKSGCRQADAIAARLAPEGVSQLVSSPYARCVQSLEPLAAILGLSVREDERLAEGAALEGRSPSPPRRPTAPCCAVTATSSPI